MKDHHFLEFYNNNIPVIICSDDTGIFQSKISDELFKICTAFNLNEEDCKKIMKDGVKYIFDENAKEKLKIILEKF